MKRITMVPVSAVLALVLAAPGFGQSAGAGGPAPSSTSSTAEVKALPAQAAVEAQAQAQARAEAEAEAQKTLEAIKQKGGRVSMVAREKTDANLQAIERKTNDVARAQGEALVASRLGADFGLPAEQLTTERHQAGCSWGNLMIAHSLQSNTKTEVTATQLLTLHEEGTGWGQIAAGLGLKLGEVVSAVQAQGRVAAGLAKPDGKVAVIHGEGARAGVAAQAGAASAVPGSGVAAEASAGERVKTKP